MAEEGTKVQLSAEVSDNTQTGFDSVKNRARSAADSVEKDAGRASDAVEGIGKGGDKAADKVDKAAKNMIGSIERATAKMQASGQSMSKYYEVLAKQRGVDASAIEPYLSQLRAVETQQTAAGVSAGKLATSMGKLPVQLGHVVTGLQSGQLPMAAMVKSGAALSTVFAGMGGPILLAVAAVGVLAYAFIKGSKELGEFQKTLIMSGNVAGATAGQMQGMATAIAQSGRSRSAAVDALTAIAKSGSVASGSLKEFSAVAVDVAKVTGQSVSETTRQFADLAKEPVQASLKLNEQYHYLTAAVYEHIKALDDQGRHTEAQSLAQKTFSDVMKQRTSEVKENLGTLERAWNAVSEAAHKAWDSMLSIGREKSNVDKLASLNQQIAILTAEQANGGWGVNAGGAAFGRPTPGGNRQAAERLNDLNKERAALVETMRAEQEKTKSVAEAQAQEQARLTWTRNGEKYLSEQVKLENEITKARNEGAAAGASQVEIEQRIAKIRADFAKSNKTSGQSDSALRQDQDYLIALKAEYDQLQSNAGEMDKYTAKQKERDVVNSHLAEGIDIEGKALTAATRQTMERRQAVLNETVAIEQSKKAKEDANAADKKLIDDATRSAEATEKRASELDAANASYGKSAIAIQKAREEEAKRTLEMAKASGASPAYIASLEKDAAANEHLTDSMVSAEYKRLSQMLEEGTRAAQDQLKLTEAEAGMIGASAEQRARIVALRKVELDYAKRTAEIDKMEVRSEQDAIKKSQLLKDAANQRDIEAQVALNKVTIDEWNKTTEEINRSLTDALMRGFEDGKGFAKNFRDTLKNMVFTIMLRPMIGDLVGGVTGIVMSLFGGGGSGSGGNNILGLASNANTLYGGYTALTGQNTALNAAYNWAGGLFGGATQAGITVPVYDMAANGTYVAANTAAVAEAGSGATAASTLAGLGWVAAIPMIGMLFESWFGDDDRRRLTGAASSGGSYAQVTPGSTGYDLSTGSLPDRDAVIAAMNEYITQGDPLTADQLAGVSDFHLVRELAGLPFWDLSSTGPVSAAQILQNTAGNRMSNSGNDIGDYYRGAGYLDPQSMGWWEDWHGRDDLTDPRMIEASRQIALGIQQPIALISRALGQGASDIETQVGLAIDSSTRHNYWLAHLGVTQDGRQVSDWGTTMDGDQINFKTQDDAMKGLFSAALDSFKAFNLPGWAAAQVDAAKDQLDKLTGDDVAQQAANLYQQAAADIANTITVIQQLIDVFPDFSSSTQDFIYAVAQQMGGLQNMQQAWSGFVDNFYSDAEKQQMRQDLVAQQFAQIGLAAPSNREDFRALVDAAIALGNSAGSAADQVNALGDATEGAFGAAAGSLLGLDEATVLQLKDTAQATDAYNAALQAAMESTGLSAVELTAALLGMQDSVAQLFPSIADAIGITQDSISGLFKSVLQDAKSAEEARQLGEQKAGDMFMDAVSSAMINSVMGPLMAGLVDPLITQIAAGAATAATINVAGASVAAETLAVGGAASASTLAAGGMVAGSDMAQGGLVAGNNMAAGGAAAATGIASVVNQAVDTINAIAQVMGTSEFQDAFRNFTAGIGAISGALYTGVGRVASAVGYTPAAAVSAQTTAADTARNAWQDAYDALMKSADAQRQIAQEQLDAAQGVLDVSRSAARELRGTVDANVLQSAQGANAFINQALQTLRATGYLPEQDQLSQAIDAARAGLGATPYASALAQQRDALVLAGKLSQIADLAEPQRDAAQQQLDYLDELNKTAREQLDAQQGNTTATLALGEAIANWAKVTGNSLPVPAFASGGMHLGGLALVGERGPELMATGPARFYSAEQTRGLIGGNDDLVRAVRQMQASIEALRQDARTHARAIVDLQQRATRTLDDWNVNGLPEERELEPA